jgi:hypothetical protein
METLFHITSSFSATAVSALCSAVWEGLILAACVAVCLRLFPGLSAAARSVVWLNVFLLVAVFPLVPSPHILSLVEKGGFPGTPGVPAPIQLDLGWSVAIAALWCMLSLGRAIQLLGEQRPSRRARLCGLCFRLNVDLAKPAGPLSFAPQTRSSAPAYLDFSGRASCFPPSCSRSFPARSYSRL